MRWNHLSDLHNIYELNSEVKWVKKLLRFLQCIYYQLYREDSLFLLLQYLNSLEKFDTFMVCSNNSYSVPAPQKPFVSSAHVIIGQRKHFMIFKFIVNQTVMLLSGFRTQSFGLIYLVVKLLISILLINGAVR